MGGFSPVQQLFSFLVVSFNSQTSSPFFVLLPSCFSFVPSFFLPILLQLLLFLSLFCYFVWGSCVISITCTTIVFFSGCFFQLPNPLLTTPRPCFFLCPLLLSSYSSSTFVISFVLSPFPAPSPSPSPSPSFFFFFFFFLSISQS